MLVSDFMCVWGLSHIILIAKDTRLYRNLYLFMSF